MIDLLISIASLIIGVIATVLVSSYYFRKSFTKSLTAYVQFSSLPLRGIDPEARKAIEIKYHDQQVENLFEIQFLIANTGDKAIRDVIDPLTLTIPNGSSLLDASLLHVSPDGRRVTIKSSDDQRHVSFSFPVLNSGEFFIVKLLLNGAPETKAFIFAITADELPPTLKIQHLPPDAIATSRKRGFDRGPLIVGSVFLLFGSAVATLVWNNFSKMPNPRTVPLKEFLTSVGLLNGAATALAAFAALVFILFGSIIAAMSFTGGTFPPSHAKFIVPNNKRLLKNYRPFVHAIDADVDE